MTDKQRVFCKDCKWMADFMVGGLPTITYVGCKHPSVYKIETVYDPINGESKKYSGGDCRKRNANCDCPDYEPQEKTDG